MKDGVPALQDIIFKLAFKQLFNRQFYHSIILVASG